MLALVAVVHLEKNTHCHLDIQFHIQPDQYRELFDLQMFVVPGVRILEIVPKRIRKWLIFVFWASCRLPLHCMIF